MVRKPPEAGGKLPDVAGKLPEEERKLPEAKRKLPEVNGKLPEAGRKLPEQVRKPPEARGKLPAARGKLPAAPEAPRRSPEGGPAPCGNLILQSTVVVMDKRVTATEATRRFSPASPSRRVTLRELVERLRQLGAPDPRFADDLAEIQASQPPIGEAPRSS